MFAALTTAPVDPRRAAAMAAHPASGSPRRVRTAFPVGARFPRLTVEQRAAYLDARTPRTRTEPIFPLGARFPRRTERDVLSYLAARIATIETPVTAARRIYPVGARFPRR